MMDLFEERLKKQAPLADRMRPTTFDEFLGQEDLTAPGSPLRRAIDSEHIGSLIFWGPPGSGKTTLAYLIAHSMDVFWKEFSAVATSINDVRQAIYRAEEMIKLKEKRTVIFIDEIHRFNKAQQDALLPYVEKGTIILIGATTENPSFEVITPLLSRLTVYVVKSMNREVLEKILLRALNDENKGLGKLNLTIDEKALEYLTSYADGDARSALNGLEFVAHYFYNIGQKNIDENGMQKALKQHVLHYDKRGEEHYNLISAFIKCLRDSDTDAALYWLARMIESGEDPKFIARRMIVFASEDIGNADINALQLAISVARAVEFVGLPEARINLAHGVVYLAKAKKSRTSYDALMQATEDAKKGSFGVPLGLRNPVTELMKNIGYGQQNDEAKSNFPKEIGSAKYYHE